MFVLANSEHVLEQVEQLLLAQRGLRGARGGRLALLRGARLAPQGDRLVPRGARGGRLAPRGARGGRLALRPPSGVLVSAHDLVELAHPRADHRLLGQAVDLGQTADAALDVVAEDVAEVGGTEAAALDHRRHALAAHEYVEVAVNSAVERLVGWDRQLAVQKRLHSGTHTHIRGVVLQRSGGAPETRLRQRFLNSLGLHTRTLVHVRKIATADLRPCPAIQLLVFECL